MSDAPKGLRLYNTLTRTKEDFFPIDPRNVRMYVCGPTVYDFAHIGNARPVIVFDVLFRLLRLLYGQAHVTYVRNITDVDDKINARALRDFGGEIASGKLSLNEAIRRVTEKTADQFHKDVATLGCLKPTVEPRATEFVEPRPDGKADMISLIQRLIERGHAYVAAGEVLFDTVSMPDYGQLSKRQLDEQQAGARVAVDAHKKNPGDFVLWKLSSPEEPGWDSPWGRGRPGWHIECSAMSAAYLGEVFDIHGGGLDLIFPHHENEIAQSRCAHGTDVMAKVWMHNGFLQVEGQKMSKSLGNFLTIDQILNSELHFAMFELEPSMAQQEVARRWNGLGMRLAMLQTHYRSPIDWTSSRFELARSEVIEWHEKLKEINFQPGLGYDNVPEVVQALKDDLNVSEALALVRQFARGSQHRQLGEALELIGLFDADLMGRYDLLVSQLDAPINRRVEERLALIAAKNWAEADRIRDELLAQGIQLKDGKDPVTGERVTTWEVKR
ncbi:cysteine--tRNA ligase [Mesorhizobium sp. M9A.F.Ca.ET.002.03.1.2]|uniref:cysteine--tRNA ligase n=1 Tax=Mesorhizobium sp. M9A.F.Ca.ET.002.03.1.2 TaxID=2493668 RepID=UPI000F761891|nr:cysteine--tRNA ligase [Mesorhizobium sp. M9A.F.Ca.ET.002.03.1.2]AZN99038.1 cysteine--tRNA ligase [Mesorhizobium sp. M9A.F.Ca.ET.002.03.1.2]